MITLTEYIQASEWDDTISEAILAEAEGYTLGYDHKTQKTIVGLVDANENQLTRMGFDNSEMAFALLEEYFDIDEEDQQWNESYEWVNDSSTSTVIDESLDTVEKFIEKKAIEYQIRLSYIDPDIMFDGMYGIEVFFDRNNNRRDLDLFIKELSYDLLRTYGIQSYDYDGNSLKLAL